MSIFAVSDGEKREEDGARWMRKWVQHEMSARIYRIRDDLVIGLGRNPSDVCSGDYSIGESLAQFSALASCV